MYIIYIDIWMNISTDCAIDDTSSLITLKHEVVGSAICHHEHVPHSYKRYSLARRFRVE